MVNHYLPALAGLAAILAVACGPDDGGIGDFPTAPSPVVPQQICTEVIEAIDLNLNAAGPRLAIDVRTDGPAEVEVYRGGELVATGGSRHLELDVHFNSTYDVRARVAPGCPWSQWFHKTVGPQNIDASSEANRTPAPPPVSLCTTKQVFIASGSLADATDTIAVAIAPGTYDVVVRTTDPNHRAGYQPEQTAERLTVSALLANGSTVVIGTTDDIPTTATSVSTPFTATFAAAVTQLRMVHAWYPQANPNSVYSTCATFTLR